jgi:hypothetical protein
MYLGGGDVGWIELSQNEHFAVVALELTHLCSERRYVKADTMLPFLVKECTSW